MLKHPDQLDNAAELEQLHTERSVAAARAKNRPEQVKNEDGSWPHTECISCGEDIPEVRLNLGKVRCVTCQSLLERERSQYRS